MPERLAVVGGGVVGSFAAMAAALDGLDVTVIDPRGPMGGAASRSAGVVTVQLEDRDDVLLVLESLRLIEGVARASAVRTGFLQIGREEDLRDSVEAMRAADVRYELLSPDDVKHRWPELRVNEGELSVYTDLDLAVEPTVLASEVEARLKELGVKVLRGEVTSIRVSGGSATGVSLANGELLRTDSVILAAGAHNRDLLGKLGLSLRVAVITCYAYRFDLGRDLGLPCFSDERRHSYWRPWGSEMVGGGYDAEWSDRPVYEHREPPRTYVERSLRMLTYRLRAQVSPVYVRSVNGPCEITGDYEPYLGEVEGISNLVVAGGLRGYGLMRGPRLGELAYAVSTGKGFPPVVEKYDLRRLLTPLDAR
ncbi:MAG: FAD-binding oxidoreductase [Thaumarchaeota archaeon]|nr:FAD-binding oxidoreductase [Candidatus Calditenuaceae archaeon]